MPQKRNPVRSTLAVACERLTHAHAGVLLGELAHEHERAVGGWHAEWEALSGALAFAGGAAAAAADAVGELEVEPSGCGRTSRRAAASSSRSASRSRSPSPGPPPGARGRRRGRGGSIVSRGVLADQRTGLSADELDALLDPTGYLGVAEALVDRALGEYERTRG